MTLAIGLPALAGLSCGQATNYKVNAIKDVSVVSVVDEWNQAENMENFNCEEYWAPDSLPLICYRSPDSEDRVPEFVIFVSRLQEKSYFIVTVQENHGESQEGKKLNSSLFDELKESFGIENVEIEN